MDLQAMRAQLETKGYVVVRELIGREDVRRYIARLNELSGFRPSAVKKGLSARGLSGSWYLPDGVTKLEPFWPLIFDETLLRAVRALVDPDVRYLQHSDLHVGFSAISWHRDSVNRQLGVGSDWDESQAPYRLVRVGIYLQSYNESSFRLGFIPGSHRFSGQVTLGQRATEARLKLLGGLSYLNPSFQMWAANAEWVATEPGDCIIFDPRTIHSGSAITGPKYSVFLAYGKENQHFYNHFNYYRRIRPELNYQEMPPALAARLQAAGLLQDQQPEYDEIQGAWVPMPLLRNAVAQRVK
ncbi:MAG: phytanoyl-CoA dioxygenase family protein [Anaerolineales bacterium]|nr:phytanoyl-CoA dioxygenase family protein [Anaerolineales bacterium]